MARTRLALYNEQGSPTISLTNCPVLEDIPISLTYEVADVRTPEKGKGSRSKTVLIPATQETNIFFQNIFNVNISLSKFNPAKKVTAIYYKNEIPQIVGLLRLIKIRRSDNDTVSGSLPLFMLFIIDNLVNTFFPKDNLDGCIIVGLQVRSPI